LIPSKGVTLRFIFNLDGVYPV